MTLSKASISHVANRLWFLSCLKEAKRFHRGLGEVAEAQKRLLLEMLQLNRFCEFGKSHGFSNLRTAQGFQEAVPAREYIDFAPYVERILKGENHVLTSEPVKLLEPTGGSSGGSKLIPYTEGLKRQFQRGISPWIADLYRNMNGLMKGQSYWSVTPVATDCSRGNGCVPIGFEDDSHYVGGFSQMLVRATQAVPEDVKRVNDTEAFWYLTILFLLRCRSLALISIWNPTFLTILDSHLGEWWPNVVHDIATGELSFPLIETNTLTQRLKSHNRPDPSRAEEIARAIQNQGSRSEAYESIWPNLKLISCWTSGAAEEHAKSLTTLFPNVHIQGKGLIATEGFVSLPIMGTYGYLPAYRSHFFEFVSTDDGTTSLLHQLETNKTYSVLITTAGGLYRYKLHDIVKVIGHMKDLPLIEFVGKADHVSDQYGEKLHEDHVHRVVTTTMAAYGFSSRFNIIAFEKKPSPSYVFYVEAPEAGDETLLHISRKIDEQLMENFQYRNCRELGQLGPVKVFRVHHNGQEAYLRKCHSNGQRLGSVKPLVLQKNTGWVDAFEGKMIG
jgi:hypothetical protein